jgi:epoxide hydrolase-like predicted phosphatase
LNLEAILMTIQAIIWDLGGVLLRTEDRQPRAQLARELNLTYADIDRLVFNSPSARQASRGEITASQHWQNLCEICSWPEDRLPELQARFWGGDRLDPELIEFIRSLKPTYTTALLSNNWSDLRQALTTQWQIADAFDEIIISAEVGLVKPDPRIFRLTAAKLGVTPEQALFVDDFIENVQAAQAEGWQAVHFQNSQQAMAEIKALLVQK